MSRIEEVIKRLVDLEYISEKEKEVIVSCFKIGANRLQCYPLKDHTSKEVEKIIKELSFHV